ncbi:ADP-ribosyltransferase [Methanimicrococcus hacksteinii]|nr:ADP-ribosyltransferase [Methanimicrococcus sp. At1]
MTEDEKELIDFHFQNLDTAIQKSKADKDYWIYKGVSDIKWLENPSEGTTYSDQAYGSFSLDFQKALEYTTLKNPVLFQLNLKKGMQALYVDQAEAEILRPRQKCYRIKTITVDSFPISKYINKETIVYTIEEFKK